MLSISQPPQFIPSSFTSQFLRLQLKGFSRDINTVQSTQTPERLSYDSRLLKNIECLITPHGQYILYGVKGAKILFLESSFSGCSQFSYVKDPNLWNWWVLHSAPSLSACLCSSPSIASYLASLGCHSRRVIPKSPKPTLPLWWTSSSFNN